MCDVPDFSNSIGYSEYIQNISNYKIIDKNTEKAKAKQIKDAEKAKAKINTSSSKRKVSESLKKQIACKQNWQCKRCNIKLPGNFEIDHIVSLKSGGTNDSNNLQALCRNCHGEKTQIENAGLKIVKSSDNMVTKMNKLGYRFANK